MNEKLLKLIKEIQKDRRLVSFDEAATKQAIILRILSCLGWDPFNIEEVCPEYSVGEKRVDFALRHNGQNKVFIEVKKVSEDLEKHQEQLLNYSFQEGVKLAILTNGVSWWFYLPLHEGSWEQRKFYTIEIYDQNPENITQKFIDFISKENVVSDRAVKNAEGLYKSYQRQYLIKETLPKAWNKLITEPDELLVELLAETTEKLCGYKPDSETVEQFLTSFTKEPEKSKRPTQPTFRLPSELPTHPVKPVITQNYAGKSIVSFVFKGNKYEVKTWKDMLIQICNIMFSIHRDRFEKVLKLRGRKRPYFSKNPNELRGPERINGTDIYVETNLSANNVVQLSKRILALFGYKEDDIAIEVR
jgi:negative regulator of replication initiation